MALNFRKFIEGLRIVPKTSSTANEKGDLDVSYTSKQFLPAAVNISTEFITINSHGFNNNDIVNFSSSGTLPSPLTVSTNYYIISATANTFQVSLSLSGPVENLSSQGTGIHTIVRPATAVINYHNGTSASPVVTEDHASQGTNALKNKDLQDSTIAVVDASDTSKKILFDAGGTASTSTTIAAAQTTNRILTLPDATDVLVGEATSATLTNKTIDGDDNTIQDVALTSLKTELPNANRVIRRDAAGVVVSDNLLPNSSEIVTIDASQTLTNKTLTTLKVDKTTPANVAGVLALPASTYALVSANVNEITAGSDGLILIVTNTSASPITIKNETGTAGNQIRTGTNGDLSLETEASLILVYNSTAPGYWYVAGGVGGAATFNIASSNVAVQAGNAVYIDSSGVVQRVDATDDTKIEFVGISLDNGGGAVRVQVSGKVTLSGTPFTGNIGKPVFASAVTPGALVQPANTNNGNWVIPVGIAVSANEMIINAAASSTAVKMQADVDPSIVNNTDLIINTVGSSSNVNIGHPVYLDASVFAQLIDAGNDSKIEFIGVSLSNGSGGGSIEVQVSGIVTIPSASFTPGSPVFVNPSALPGGSAASFYTQTIPNSAGQWIIQAGIAIAADKFVINGAGGATAVKITSETDQFVYAKVRSLSTTQSLTNGDSIVLATAGVSGITLTLPAPTAGKIFNIKKVDAAAGAVTIVPPSGTIDGAANKTISIQYASLTITSDGTNFFII